MREAEKARAFGERLKKLRHSKGFTMDDICKHIGVARSTYAGYETQERYPSVDKLAIIAQVLGTSVDYLCGLVEDKEPVEPIRNVNDYLNSISGLHWNGVPLSNEDLKPLRDLFGIVLRERIPQHHEENAPDKSGTDNE